MADEENGTVGPGSELSTFDDRHCLLSGRFIEQPHQSIRCGRCCGIFHLDALFEISSPDSPPLSSEYADLLPVLILPSKELLEQQPHEEWFCPFCLQENTTNRTHRYECSKAHYTTLKAFHLDYLPLSLSDKSNCTPFFKPHPIYYQSLCSILNGLVLSSLSPTFFF